MKKCIKISMLLLVLSSMLFVGCKEEATETDFDKLTDYMAANSLDLPDVLNGWVTSTGGINVDPTDFSVPDFYVIDIRSATDFAAGHIKDAHNSTLANILVEAENAGGKKILVVCYTGQTAAFGTAALRMMGYEAKSLKWGMCAWHPNLEAKWNSNATDFAHNNWVTSGTPPAYVEFDQPKVSATATTGAEILAERVQAMLSHGWAVSKTDVLDNPGNYFINNKWPLASWDEYGHVDGAYRIDEDLNLDGLKYLDPSKTVITYCYTGQTSAITSGWLTVLGYDAKSMLFGANGITHSKLLTGSAGSAPAKSWKGPSSGSPNNFGYYDADGNLIQ